MDPKAQDYEKKRLILEAVLAEYKRLTDEMMNHSKNSNHLFAVLVGGVAAIVGVFGANQVLSFLMIPIFVSACGILMLGEGYVSATIGYYIAEKIEHTRLKELFPEGSPIRYQGWNEPRSGRVGGIFWGVMFLLSSFLCFACLIALGWMWSDVSQSLLYSLVYVFGWMILMVYVVSSTITFRRLWSEVKRLKDLNLGT